MGYDVENVEALFRAFVDSYHAVYGRAPRNKCEELGRCVYDEACPFVEDCMPSEYVE